jgi:hypothetical protein
MCYNKEVSLVIVIYTFSVIAKLLKDPGNTDPVIWNKNVIMSLILFGLALMQLNEFFLHLFNDHKTKIHQIFTVMLVITLMTQIVITMIINNQLTSQGSVNIPINVISGIVLLIFSYFLYKVIIPNFGKFNCNPLCKASSCRLNWDTNHFMQRYNNLLYRLLVVSFCSVIILLGYKVGGIKGLLFTAITLFLSMLVSKNHRTGTFWCFIVIFLLSIIVSVNDISSIITV